LNCGDAASFRHAGRRHAPFVPQFQGRFTMATNDPNSAGCNRHDCRTSDGVCARPSHRSRRGSSVRMNWKLHVHCRVRNESVCYAVFLDRTKPDNSVRVNPATRNSETKYGFVVLTGDMIFKDFFVGVKLLLRHEHLSSAAAIGGCLSVDPSAMLAASQSRQT